MVFSSFRHRVRSTLAGDVAWQVVAIATWIPVIITFNVHVAELTTVNGGSMYPFMNADKDTSLMRDVVLNWKWAAQEKLEKGMVVTIR